MLGATTALESTCSSDMARSSLGHRLGKGLLVRMDEGGSIRGINPEGFAVEAKSQRTLQKGIPPARRGYLLRGWVLTSGSNQAFPQHAWKCPSVTTKPRNGVHKRLPYIGVRPPEGTEQP